MATASIRTTSITASSPGTWLIGRVYERHGFPAAVRFFWSLHGVVLTRAPGIRTDGHTPQMWVSTAPVVSGSDVTKHLVRVDRRFAGTVDEMNSGAGRTPQRDVCQAFVVQAVIVKPSLHVLASCGAAVKYGSHGYALGRFSVLEARKPCAVASFSHM